MNIVEDFNDYRSRMNARLLDLDDKIIKRIFNLDTNAYQPGSLSSATKELIGLSNSMVLRCDDCVRYHLQKCYELEITEKEVFEALSIATLIGGTIVIPHLRRATEFWDTLNSK